MCPSFRNGPPHYTALLCQRSRVGRFPYEGDVSDHVFPVSNYKLPEAEDDQGAAVRDEENVVGRKRRYSGWERRQPIALT